MLTYDCATGAIYVTASGRILGYVPTVESAVLAFPDTAIRLKNIKTLP